MLQALTNATSYHHIKKRLAAFLPASKFDAATLEKIRGYADIALGVWFLVVFSLIIRQVAVHEMWRDELQAWTIARDSASVGDLFQRLGFEGFPPLWHLLLMGVQLFTKDPIAMKWVHTAIATLNLVLIWRYAPLPRPIKFILMISFPLSMQFVLYCRCYALVVTFLLGALIAQDRKHPTLYWLMLGLAGQTTLLGICVASALAFHHLITEPREVLRQWRGVAIFVALVLFAMWVALPNENRLTIRDFEAYPNFETFVKHISLMMPSTKYPVVSAALSLIVLNFNAAAIASFVLMLETFFAINQIGYPLLTYHMMLLSLGLVFLAEQAGTLRKWWTVCAVLVLFSYMAFYGMKSLLILPAVPYSHGHHVADWIEKKGLQDAFWIAVPDYAGTTVAGYLNRQFYYPQCQCVSAAALWSKTTRQHVLPFAEELAQAGQVMRERNLKEAWFLAGWVWNLHEMKIPSMPDLVVTREADFFGATVPDEEYIIYKLTRVGS